MRSSTPWRPLPEFRDPRVPKLDNLRRASAAGLDVPETAWAWAVDLGGNPAAAPIGTPCVVRSGSPTEDTAATSNAGQLLSLFVREPGEFADAVARVAAALPREGGEAAGAVFVQPVVEAEAAGVTFFDGFYYEEARAAGSNVDLTSGRSRGVAARGHVRRGDAHHAWLARLHGIFGGTVDVEWARPRGRDGPPVLLQVRPALFPVRRCETLSLANHKEILGDPPSPWMVGLLAEVGRPVMRFFGAVDPASASWEEPYAVELAGRAWMNFSAFFRLMDRWGLPRAMVTEGVGGRADGPLDGRIIPGRFLRSIPTLVRLQVACLRGMSTLGRDLDALDADLDAATTLQGLWAANARALDFSIRSNFAIMSVLSGLIKVRKALGLGQAARVVTQAMMADYAELAAEPDAATRLTRLDAWLAEHGHRGPFESDPWRPRFSEMRAALVADLARGPGPPPPARRLPTPALAALARPLFLVDERREWFRDRLMRWWRRLRERILAEARLAVAAGHLDDANDVFFLRGGDLCADPSTWRDRVRAARAAREASRLLDLPSTASRDAIEAAVARVEGDGPGDRGVFRGVGLGRGAAVEGTAVRADEVTAVLGAALPPSPILVVPTLEPSWAVVFPRFAAVVSELGGELSHASILLREAGIPAVVNAAGAFAGIAGGMAVRVDPKAGVVIVLPEAVARRRVPGRDATGTAHP